MTSPDQRDAALRDKGGHYIHVEDRAGYTEMLSRLYLELSLVVPETTVPHREARVRADLATALRYIKLHCPPIGRPPNLQDADERRVAELLEEHK